MKKIFCKKTYAWLLFIMVLLAVSLTGCTIWEVTKDILSVNHADTNRNNGPKVTISKPTKEPEPSETPSPTAAEPTPTEDPKEWVYCISPVNVRAGAGSQEQILGFLTAGQKVEKLGQERGWIKIEFEGQDGWVYEKYVSEQEP